MSRPERKRRLRVIAAVEHLEPRQLMHSGPLLLKEAAVALSGTADLGPWGRLKLVDRLEKQGDHQFDALDERLTIKLDHWELRHPTLAREWGLTKPTPLAAILLGQLIFIGTSAVAHAHAGPSFSCRPRRG